MRLATSFKVSPSNSLLSFTSTRLLSKVSLTTPFRKEEFLAQSRSLAKVDRPKQKVLNDEKTFEEIHAKALSVVEILHSALPPLTNVYPRFQGLRELVATARAVLRNFKTAPLEVQVEAAARLHKAVRFIRPGMTEEDKQTFWEEIYKSRALLEGEKP
jgi:hypothetical protein